MARVIPEIKKVEKFLCKINAVDGNCWNWSGEISKEGYGLFSISSKRFFAHRISFEMFKEKLNTSLVIDHVCRNRKCVNPDHLRQVTTRINNIENSISLFAKKSSQSHCVNGHEFSEDSIYWEKGRRKCVKCRRKNALDRYYKLKGDN